MVVYSRCTKKFADLAAMGMSMSLDASVERSVSMACVLLQELLSSKNAVGKSPLLTYAAYVHSGHVSDWGKSSRDALRG